MNHQVILRSTEYGSDVFEYNNQGDAVDLARRLLNEALKSHKRDGINREIVIVVGEPLEVNEYAS